MMALIAFLPLLAFIPEWIQDFGVEVEHIWPLLVVCCAFLTFSWRITKRTIKNELRKTVREEIAPIQKQFENNGGSSMKDALDRISETLDTHTESDAANFELITDALLGIVAGQSDIQQRLSKVENAQHRKKEQA